MEANEIQLHELRTSVADLKRRLDGLRAIFDVEGKRVRRDELDQQIGDPGFWNNQERATKVQRERAHIEALLTGFERTTTSLNDAGDLLELVAADNDPKAIAELAAEIGAVRTAVEQMEFRRVLGGENDANSAYIDINAGAGGTDSQDWAQMLLRMYLRYAERRGFQVEMIDEQAGEEAGIKSCTMHVLGEYAYGYLKVETGVHRLVRISPFDGNARRHTSFASVFVYPEVDDDIDIEIRDEDLKVDTLRSGGAGGQHVNKTESAVRFTHIPTGIVVLCQQERSQHKNRSLAMKLLKAKLYEREIKLREAERDITEAGKMDIRFGSQIRNYVLHPYRLAKDLRSGWESGNVDAVLDGDLQPVIESALLANASSRRPDKA
ncbi:MAG: peptide chain release factor 2 [Deltaproteobacteria bacterium]|nr:peptide chain release factor 2 [Deltaproteobacteria bacterium]